MDISALVAAQMRAENQLRYREPGLPATHAGPDFFQVLASWLTPVRTALRSLIEGRRGSQDLVRPVPAE
jgi:hypothetical protein